MLLERSLHPRFTSNAYLIADRAGGHGAIVDPGAPLDPLIAAAARNDVRIDMVLLTHHHHDHVEELPRLRERGLPVYVHPLEAELVDGPVEPLEDGAVVEVGELPVAALLTPGHTAGMLAFRAGDRDVLTGDTLFRGSVGGVRAPGSTSYEDLRRSVMDVLLALPPETRLHPGHTDPTTVADELEGNPFVRIWRGLDPEGDEPCTALGEPATLILRARDYDGGTKCWVRWPDGRDDIVPGSRVQAREA